jgi:hypothetical protein
MVLSLMRIFLKVIAAVIGLEVANTILLIWRMARLGGLSTLIGTGTFGLATILGWFLTLAVGPFAVAQLWRLRESGRRASLLLAAFAFVYYVAGLLFFQEPGAKVAAIIVPIVGNLLLSVLLLSSPATRVCRNAKPVQPSNSRCRPQ